MNVREAIEILQEADPEAILIVARDEEGNGYRKANLSIGETALYQDRELITVCPEDIETGEYEGWEDEFFPAVVAW